MDLVLIHPRHPETPSRHCLDGVRMGSESVWGCINSININSFNLIPNLVAKNYDRPWYSYIAFITLYCIKMHISWGVWIVSGGVCMGSEFVWGCINTNSVGKNVYRSWQLRYSLFFQCPLIRKDAYVWGVSWWCLWVSDGLWIIFHRTPLAGSAWVVSGWCLECAWGGVRMYQYQIHWPIKTFKQIELCHNTRIFPLSGEVWVVSGWCLRVSGWCLDGVWGCLGRHQNQIS